MLYPGQEPRHLPCYAAFRRRPYRGALDTRLNTRPVRIVTCIGTLKLRTRQLQCGRNFSVSRRNPVTYLSLAAIAVVCMMLLAGVLIGDGHLRPGNSASSGLGTPGFSVSSTRHASASWTEVNGVSQDRAASERGLSSSSILPEVNSTLVLWNQSPSPKDPRCKATCT